MERDGVFGFKQFCAIFPHIRCLCSPHIFLKCHIKMTCPSRSEPGYLPVLGGHVLPAPAAEKSVFKNIDLARL